MTPATAAEKTVQKRTATFKLSEDGTLEGDVRMEYTGHLAVVGTELFDQVLVEIVHGGHARSSWTRSDISQYNRYPGRILPGNYAGDGGTGACGGSVAANVTMCS